MLKQAATQGAQFVGRKINQRMNRPRKTRRQQPRQDNGGGRQEQRTYNVPTNLSVATGAQNALKSGASRTDSVIDVMSASDAAGLDTRVTIYPIFASNPDIDPSTTGLAEAFSFYRFTDFRLTYASNVGTDTKGKLSISFVPTWDTAKSITDVDSAVQNGWTETMAAYVPSPKVYFIPTRKYLNQQYYESGWSYMPEDKVKYDDPTASLPQVQGYIVIARGQGAGGDPVKWGVITLSYRIELLKPKSVDAQPTSHMNYQLAQTANAQWSVNMAAATRGIKDHTQFQLSAPDSTNFKVTAKHKIPYLITIVAKGGVAGSPLGTITATNCEFLPVGTNMANITSGLFLRRYMVRPYTQNSTLNFANSTMTVSAMEWAFTYITNQDIEWFRSYVPSIAL